MTDDDGDEFIYDLVIKVWHPNEDVGRISREFGLEPTMSIQSGKPIRLITGVILPKISPATLWRSKIGYKTHNRFFEVLQDLLERLEAAEYLLGLNASGGQVTLSVHLAGQTGISDVLPVSDLARIAKIGVGLEVWVFPEMRE